MREVKAKTILTKSRLADYCVNAYMGCGFGCEYCYAQLIIRKFHPGKKWGSYVDVKINAPELLEREITKVKRGTVLLSSVTDPYQPLEKKYDLTKKCLEILQKHDFPVSILTKSSLVVRDIELLKKFTDCNVGVTITTDNNKILRLFEPFTPEFSVRINTLKKLRESGLRTYAFIGPMLPMDPETVADNIVPYVDYVFIDRPNYSQLWKSIANRNKLDFSKEYFNGTKNELAEIFKENKIEVKTLF
ncbi:radical SAM protein [archaeon]|nr:radical SAM protein [archaeon]